MIGSAHPPCERGVIAAAAPVAAGDRRRQRLTLAATILGSSLAFIDGSVVNVALPAISRALGADATAAQWVVNAYLLMLGSLVLAGGSLADRFGRRRVFVAGVGVFTLASVGCGLAPGVEALIAARGLQGVGAALLTPASLARAISVVMWAAAGCAAAGGVVAGAMLGRTGK